MTASLGAAMDVRFGATAEEFAAYVTALGLDHVEFKREYLHGHPEAPDPETVRDLAGAYDITVTYHAPFRDWNLGSFNDAARAAAVEMVTQTLDDAATAGAEAVVVHGGSVPARYPDWVRARAREHAIASLQACADHAADVGVPLCLENQPASDAKRRYTTTPADLARTLDAVAADPDVLGVTLDVGHAKVNGYDVSDFVERFGDRITVCHLHDNDGTSDDHEPLTDYERFLDAVPADQFVFETKSVRDVATSIGREAPPFEPSLSRGDRSAGDQSAGD